MEMHIHIFWDALAPAGFQLPVARNIAAMTGIRVTVGDNHVRMMGYAGSRQQLDAAALLTSLSAYKRHHRITDPVLLVVSQDLFSPHHSFLFGLARADAGAAVVSAARLNNEYYGREGRDDDLVDRISKEGAHETGHLFGLPHCDDPECIMFRPDTLAELDRKKKAFCTSCQEELTSLLADGIHP
jgi:archaemetzincin